MRRVEVDSETKRLLQRNGAVADDQFEELDPDRYIIRVDEQVFQKVQEFRQLGESWTEAFKNYLRLGVFLPVM